MLHHTRRWNRDHLDELIELAERHGHAGLGGRLRRLGGLQRTDKALLRSDARGAAAPRGVADARRTGRRSLRGARTSRSSAHAGAVGETLWLLSNRANDPFDGAVCSPGSRLPGAPRPAGSQQASPTAVSSSLEDGRSDRVSGSDRRLASLRRGSSQSTCPPGWSTVPLPPQTRRLPARREGTYGEAPCVEEWKPLPPRLHDFVEVERPAGHGRFGIGVLEVMRDGMPLTNVTLERRAHAASVGARLPTEDEWQAAAAAGVSQRAVPHLWNWTESEHRDGRTRFAILKGGSDAGRLDPSGTSTPATCGRSVRQAAARRRRSPALTVDRVPAGGRPTMTRPLEGIRVVEAATLFAAPLRRCCSVTSALRS